MTTLGRVRASLQRLPGVAVLNTIHGRGVAALPPHLSDIYWFRDLTDVAALRTELRSLR